MASLILNHIERGSVSFATTDVTKTVTLTTTLASTAKTVLLFSVRCNSTSPINYHVLGRVLSTTQIQFERAATPAVAAVVEYQVIEFFQGITVQHFYITTATGTSNDTTITAVTLAKAFPILSHSMTGAVFGTDDISSVDLTSTTNLRVISGAEAASRVCAVQVVEIDDATVQRVAGTTGTGATADVTVTTIDSTKTFWFFGLSETTGNIGMEAFPYLSYINTTTLRFTRADSTSVDFSYIVFVVSLSAGVTVQNIATTIASSGSTVSPTITSSVVTSTALLVNGVFQYLGESNVADDDAGYNAVTLSGLTSTAFTATRAATPAVSSTSNVQVLTFIRTTRWVGGGGNDNFSTSANWDNGVPVAGDTLEFAGTTRLTPNNDIAADTSFAAITFISGAGAFTIGGNRITIAGDIRNSDDSLQTISLNMIFDATRTFLGSGNIDVTGVISGAGGLQKNDTNTLTLSGLNTYTGITKIVQGTLSINTIKNVSGGSSSVGAPTSVANGTIEMGGFGATLKYTGSGSTTDRVVYMNGGAGSTFSFDQSGASGLLKFTSAFTYANGAKTIALLGSTSGTGEISGSIANTASGAVSLTKTGTGTWALSAANTYSGGTTVSGGTLNLSATSSLPADSNLIVSNATVNTIGSAYSMINNYNSGTITINAGGTVSANNTALNSHNIFDLVMNGGTLAGGTAADADYGHFELLNSISATDTSTISAKISGKATRTITVSSAKTLTISGALQNNPDGNLAITKAGTGTLTLSVVNSFTGAVIVNAGTISTTAPNTATGAIGTASGITINSGGTISATGDNSFVGSVTSGAKTITINSGGTLTSTTNTSCHLHAVVMNGGTLSATTARADYANWNPDYGISTPGTGSTTSTISGGNIALTQTSGVVFNIGSGDTVNVTSVIAHATIAPDNGLIKSGTGTLTLGVNDVPLTNTYSGGTTISGGTINLTSLNNALLGTGTVILGSGTTLHLERVNLANNITNNGGTINLDNGFGSTISGNINNTTLLNIIANYDSQVVSGIISGLGGVTITKQWGNGIVTFTGTNLYTGTTTITSGILQIGDGVTDGSIATSANIVNNAALIYNVIGSRTYANVISGTGTLEKKGAGTLTLSNTNTYTGTTTITAGTLLVTGSTHASSAVAVNNTGTLGGTGNVYGAITQASGSTIAPGLSGVSIGTLNTANVTMNAGSTLSVDLNGTTPTYDKINSSGTVSCAGTLTVANIVNSVNGKVYIIVGAGTVSGTFSGLAENATFTVNDVTLKINYTGTTVTLTDVTSSGNWFLLDMKNDLYNAMQNVNGMR